MYIGEDDIQGDDIGMCLELYKHLELCLSTMYRVLRQYRETCSPKCGSLTLDLLWKERKRA